MRGRKPKPRHLRVIEGNPGKRALPEDGVRLPSEYAAPPEFLDEVARAAWERLVPPLVERGLFTVLDHDSIAAYCEAFSRWRKHEQSLKDAGQETFETHGRQGRMIRTRPELGIISEQIRLMTSIGSNYGFSPVARMRLKDVGQGDLFNPFDNV